MYIPDKLRNNRFREVAIPKRRDLFARFGFTAPAEAMFAGDDVLIPSSGRKTDILADMDEYDKMMAREEAAAARKAAASKQADSAE